ncbi:ATPase [Cytobacillus kochii]|uniref:ATPase n=2 Tax=Bacillaceae TaxID=186817 RepID=UPI00316AC25E
MIFTQEINVIHEKDWTTEDIQKAHEDWKKETEQGWHYMFLGLKELVETGKITYPSF